MKKSIWQFYWQLSSGVLIYNWLSSSFTRIKIVLFISMNNAYIQCGNKRSSPNYLGCITRSFTRKGAENRVADALSRRPHSVDTCLGISSVVPQWCSEVAAAYTYDPQAQAYIAQLALDPNSVPHFSLQQGLLRYKNKIWLGNNKLMQQKVMQALHASAVGGHSGVPVTCQRVRQFFAWPGMKSDIYQFVTSCPTC